MLSPLFLSIFLNTNNLDPGAPLSEGLSLASDRGRCQCSAEVTRTHVCRSRRERARAFPGRDRIVPRTVVLSFLCSWIITTAGYSFDAGQAVTHLADDVGRLLTKSGTVASISSFGVRPSWPLSPPDSKAFALKMLPNGLRGGAGQESPPALSPNLPGVVKVEPRLTSSPCDAFSPPPGKKSRQDWLPSPPSLDSLSPPPTLTNNNGLSPTSSYDAYCSTKDKDDLSPPSSVMNGYDYDKKKKGPAPRQQEELCLVCGDRASGYHYNALTCEGCKGFFRRSITKNAVYQCKYGNNCEIDMYMRRKCQECRLKKCLSVGMRPECVVPEYQCAIKRETKKAQKDKDKPNSTTRDSGSDKEEKPIGSPSVVGQPKTMSKAQEDLISRLVVYQEEYESPSEEDFKKITAFPLGDSEEDSLKRFQHITEITILTVQLIVEFSKRVPGFDTLSREDQITLLKACSSEVMMLRTARKYDIKTDSIVFANNQPYTRENYRSACMGDSADSIFHFCRNMCVLKVDNAEYALLTAIVIFSERPCLQEPKKVEKIQEFYIETLRAYISTNRPPGKNYFARLLSTLVELRTLGNMNSELCFSLKVQNKKLPAFLEEIWDIQQ